MHHSTEMRCDYVKKGNGISKKSNELDVPGQGDLQALSLIHILQVGRRPENQGKNIVVIVPDNGMKYLSTPMYRQK